MPQYQTSLVVFDDKGKGHQGKGRGKHGKSQEQAAKSKSKLQKKGKKATACKSKTAPSSVSRSPDRPDLDDDETGSATTTKRSAQEAELVNEPGGDPHPPNAKKAEVANANDGAGGSEDGDPADAVISPASAVSTTAAAAAAALAVDRDTATALELLGQDATATEAAELKVCPNAAAEATATEATRSTFEAPIVDDAEADADDARQEEQTTMPVPHLPQPAAVVEAPKVVDDADDAKPAPAPRLPQQPAAAVSSAKSDSDSCSIRSKILHRLFRWPLILLHGLVRFFELEDSQSFRENMPVSVQNQVLAKIRNAMPSLKEHSDPGSGNDSVCSVDLPKSLSTFSDNQKATLYDVRRKINSTPISTTFSGIDVPATALAHQMAELGEAIGLWSPALDDACEDDAQQVQLAMELGENMFSCEVYGPSQDELDWHPHSPTCQFGDILGFMPEVWKKKMDAASDITTFVAEFSAAVLDGKVRANEKCHCMKHGRPCKDRHAYAYACNMWDCWNSTS